MKNNEKIIAQGRPKTLLLVGLMFMMSLFLVNLVSAVWYNPLTWDDKNVVEKGDTWVQNYNDNPDFYSVIPDNSKHDADIYLCSKTATKKSDLKDLDFATSDKNKETDLKTKEKLKAIEYEGAFCYYYKPTDNEKFLKFDKHSTHFVYTTESITAYSDTELFNNNQVELGTLSLITEDYEYLNGKPNIQLGVGLQLLTHTFYIENYSNSAITNLRTIDMATNEEIERNANLKWLSYVEEPTYETVCNDVVNETSTTSICEEVEIGTALTKEQWNTMDSAIEGENYILGIFSDTKEGDYADVDFDYYGVSVLASPIDWATWDSSLNTNIVSYYKLDENAASTTVADSAGSNTGTASTTTNNLYTASGKINSAFDFDNTYDVDTSIPINFNPSTTDYTISSWIYPSVVGEVDVIWGSSTSSGSRFYFRMNTDGSLALYLNDAAYVTSTTLVSAGNWYHTLITLDGTGGVELFVDGTSEDTGSSPSYTASGDLHLGNSDGITSYYNGIIDEVGIWDRELTQTEITLLASAPPYGPAGANPPVVSNENPTNDTTTIFNNINLNATVVSELPVKNVSLEVNGSIVETSTAGTNNTVYNFNYDVTEGTYTWKIIAYNNESQLGEGEERFLTTAWAAPVLTTPLPLNGTMYTSPTVNFNVTAHDDVGIASVALLIDGVVDQNKTSVTNNTLQTFSKALSTGIHNWSFVTYDTYGLNDTTETRYLNITISSPIITLIEPSDNEYKTVASTDFTANVYDNGGITNVSLYIDGSLDQTSTSGLNNSNYTFNKVLPDGTITWYIKAVDSDGYPSDSATRTLNTDLNNPIISTTLNTPTIYNYGDNINVTYTATDTFLDTCWYNYNSVDTTFACSTGVSQNVLVPSVAGQTVLTFYANDSVSKQVSSVETIVYDSTAPKIETNLTCYQESTIVSNQSGIDGTCNLSYAGSNGGLDSDIVDGNFNSSHTYSGVAYQSKYLTYYKPTDATSVDWKIKTSGKEETFNIPEACFNQYSDRIVLEIGVINDATIFTCITNTWITLLSSTDTVYEEAVIWEIQPTVYNIGDSVSISAKTTDANNLDTCWYDYNSINTTYSCSSDIWEAVGITTVASKTEVIVYANDTLGNINSTNVSFQYDPNAPTIVITSPDQSEDYSYPGEPVTLNTTVTDTNLEACWYEYNNTNTTIAGCTSGVLNSQILGFSGVSSITVYANDTVGNLASETRTWDTKVGEISRSYNAESYETQQEQFNISLTANSSLTKVELRYNGINYPSTKSGTTYTSTIDLPAYVTGNVSFRWKFTYAGDEFYSTYSYQQVNETVFTICNANYTDDFLNISFKDEATLTAINASIPSATFNYYLGSGTTKKEYTYYNTTNHYSYLFCGTPDLDINVEPYVQYKQGTDYPQRIWDSDAITFTSTVTQSTLYLLNAVNGLYVTFQLINSAEQSLEGVLATASRTILGLEVIVGVGITDAAGGVTFWLNPDFIHEFTFSLAGYETYLTSFAPTQPTYTLTLGGGEYVDVDCSIGIKYSTSPQGNFVDLNDSYNFSYTVSTSSTEISGFNASLYYGDGTFIDSEVSTANGGTLSFLNIDTSDADSLYMTYTYSTNDTLCLSSSQTWLTQSTEGRGFSIWHFFEDVDLYMDANILGVMGESGTDTFTKSLLAVVILIMTVGILVSRYGIASEAAIMGIIFSIILLMDFGLGFIPTIQIGSLVAIDYFVSFVALLILVGYVVKEERY